MTSARKIGQQAIRQEAKGLQALAEKLDKNYDDAIAALIGARFIFLTGVGKSGQVCKKLASSMTSLGSPAVFIHPTEAAHGDLGILTAEDALIVVTRSGKAQECHTIVDFANEIGCPTICITENPGKTVSGRCKIVLKLPKVSEVWGHAPTTSTAMQMALGDSIGVALAEVKGYNWEDFQRIHPAGHLDKHI